jgi:Leucine-rich repeat (LRR) protein
MPDWETVWKTLFPRETFSFSGPISFNEMQALTKAITNVKELYLRNNLIGDDGAQILARTLTQPTCLKKLYLRKNQIGDECKSAETRQVVQIHIYYLSGLVEFSKKLKNSLLSYYDNKILGTGQKDRANGPVS